MERKVYADLGPTIQRLEKTYDIVLLDRLPGLSMGDFRQLCVELETAIENKCQGQSDELVAEKKVTATDSLWLACRASGEDPHYFKVMEIEHRQWTYRMALGGLFSLAALALAVWAFALGDLKTDQREILKWLLPICSGIASYAFAGNISLRGTLTNLQFVKDLVVGATGGFAVWLISVFILFPVGNDFAVTVHLKDESNHLIQVNGQLTLELPSPVSFDISSGQSYLHDLSPRWRNQTIDIICHVQGYEPIKNSITLAPDEEIDFLMQKTN